MANKRMFSNDVISNDSFIEMPDSSQNLYFHLSMNADDDGFVSNYKSVMRMLGKKEDDLKMLIAKSFIIPFENGLLVIRHWRMNNYIQKDRYKETIFKKEKALLKVDESNVYNLDTNCIHSIDKIRLDSSSNSNNNISNLEDRDKSMREEEEDIYTFTEKNFGRTITPLEITKLQEWQKQFSEDMLKYAIELSVMSNAKNFKYIEGIINNWTSSQFKTLEEVKEKEKKKGKPIEGELFEYDWLNGEEDL